MAAEKILMLAGAFSAAHGIFVFQHGMAAVGHTVRVGCPDKQAGEPIETSLHDFEGDQTCTEKPGHLFTPDKTSAEMDSAAADAVHVAGGNYIDVAPDGAFSDRKLVSAEGWPGLAAFMRECQNVLGTVIRHG